MPINASTTDNFQGFLANNELPAPTLQPSVGAVSPIPLFGTNEPFWWNNGIWGNAGYAIPNLGGKLSTPNEKVWSIFDFIGLEMFALMHQPDVKFRRPPNAEWLQDLVKMVRLGKKRMLDIYVGWTDERKGDSERADQAGGVFNIYPIPFFGGRVRQPQAKMYAGITLRLLSEIAQHADNEYDNDITAFMGSMITRFLRHIEYDIATRFLGLTREEASAEGFVLPDVTAANYKPDSLFTKAEMEDGERPPARWWPTPNDLSAIRGIPAPAAMAYRQQWPDAERTFGDGGDVEGAWPGLVRGRGIPVPGSREAAQGQTETEVREVANTIPTPGSVT